MNAVDVRGRARKGASAVFGVALAGCIGWYAVAADHLLGGPSEAASAGPARSSPPTTCAAAAPAGQSWQPITVDVPARTPTTAAVGAAAIEVRPPARDGHVVSWVSDIGVDAVVVDQSDRSRVETFARETFGARQQATRGDVDRLTFCYDLELTVNKDVNSALDRVYQWSLEHSVHPSHLRLAAGGAEQSKFRINARRGPPADRGWRVSGTISIDNLTPSPAVIDRVYDVTSDGHTSDINCPVELPGYVLEAGGSVSCTYQTRLPDASVRTATATVSTSGPVGGSTATAPIDFDGAHIHPVNEAIRVTDNHGKTWSFQHTASKTYARTFTCRDAGLHPSAVRIVGALRHASTSVSVDCPSADPKPTSARR